jgi:hypothetical protein
MTMSMSEEGSARPVMQLPNMWTAADGHRDVTMDLNSR